MEQPRVPKLAQTRTKLQLTLWPDLRLKDKAKPVTEFGPELGQKIIDMYEVMKHYDGLGLAGPQVGIMEQIVVYKDYDKGEAECYMINPEIIEEEGEVEEWEGCLSFPGVTVKVKRAEKIKVRYQDMDGNELNQELTGLTARCIQHEKEHLEGITFVRYLSSLKRDVVTRKMRKVGERVGAYREKMAKSKRRDPRINNLPVRS